LLDLGDLFPDQKEVAGMQLKCSVTFL